MEQGTETTIIIFVGVFIVVATVFGYSLYRKKKRIEATWEGVVIDKAVEETVHQTSTNSSGSGFSVGGGDSAVTRDYSIIVRPNVGDTFKWPISSGFYETVQIGDKLSKQPGQETPEIIQKAQA